MGKTLSRSSEVNYRDFHIVEEAYRMDVQVTSDSDFLAKRIFDETSYRPVGAWEAVKRILLTIFGLFFKGISYEVATR